MVALLPYVFEGDAPVVREMRPGLSRAYRVVVTQDEGDRYAYRLGARITAPKTPKGTQGEVRFEFKMTDYHATMAGQSVSSRLIGGGQVALEPNGLPSGLNVAGPQGPVWLPLIALYLPNGGESSFDLGAALVGPNLALSGKGELARKDGRVRIALDGALVRGGKAVGSLKIATTLDGAGWPEKAEGTLVSEDGTYRFTLSRA